MALVPEDDKGKRPDPRRCTCRVTGITDLARGVRMIGLTPETDQRIDFCAGQYAMLSFGDASPRPYSIASAPGARELSFYIRDTGNTGGNSAYAAHHLQIGENVAFDGPYGDAHFVHDAQSPVIAIAGGLGIAPIKSVVETALEGGFSKPLHLYLGVRNEDELYLKNHFIELGKRHGNLTFVPVLSDAPQNGDNGTYRHGMVSDAVGADFEDLSTHRAYIAGPPAMIAATMDMLGARGIPDERIHCDNPGHDAPDKVKASGRQPEKGG